jgi:hypothetical protein
MIDTQDFYCGDYVFLKETAPVSWRRGTIKTGA